MLNIRRGKCESVIINRNITITVKEIRGQTVMLGIEAPKDVEIHREEVLQEVASWERLFKGTVWGEGE